MTADLKKEFDELSARKVVLENELNDLNKRLYAIEEEMIPDAVGREDGWNVEHEGPAAIEESEDKLFEREKIYD